MSALLIRSFLGLLGVDEWGISLLGIGRLLSWAAAWFSWSSLLGHGFLNVAGAGSGLSFQLDALSSLGS